MLLCTYKWNICMIIKVMGPNLVSDWTSDKGQSLDLSGQFPTCLIERIYYPTNFITMLF